MTALQITLAFAFTIFGLWVAYRLLSAGKSTRGVTPPRPLPKVPPRHEWRDDFDADRVRRKR